MPAMEDRDVEEIRAHGQLPNADIDIIYRRRQDESEFIGISIQTMPFSFDRLLAISDPFRFWGQVMEAAWWPWLQGLRAMDRLSHSPAPPRSNRPRRASD